MGEAGGGRSGGPPPADGVDPQSWHQVDRTPALLQLPRLTAMLRLPWYLQFEETRLRLTSTVSENDRVRHFDLRGLINPSDEGKVVPVSGPNYLQRPPFLYICVVHVHKLCTGASEPPITVGGKFGEGPQVLYYISRSGDMPAGLATSLHLYDKSHFTVVVLRATSTL